MNPKYQIDSQADHATTSPPPTCRFAALTLEVEVLEERIAPAYLGDIRPAAPCCAGR